jgi:hypothetical protein
MHNLSNLRQLKDTDGTVMQGLFRTPNGSITVSNNAELARKKLEIDRATRVEDRINKHEADISSIKDMLSLILQKLEK